MQRQDIVVAGAVRTPIGRFGGRLSSLPVTELGMRASVAAIERTGISPGQVDQVIFGHARAFLPFCLPALDWTWQGCLMSLAGSLSTMPLPDLLQWLASAGKTGTLRVERNKLAKWIQLERGQIVGCSSDDPPQRLGQYLLSRELITPQQLRLALYMQNESGQHLGAVLVDQGVLDADDLAEHLQAKAEETIYSAFDWDDGVFRFDEGTENPGDVFQIDLEVQHVLLRGLKRFDDMQRIRKIFEDSSVVLRYTNIPPGPEIFSDKMARMMYAAIDGDRSIAEILLHVHGSDYIVYKFLFELHRDGYIEIAGRKAVEKTPAVGKTPAVAATPVETGGPAAGPATARAAAPITSIPQPSAERAASSPLATLEFEPLPLDEPLAPSAPSAGAAAPEPATEPVASTASLHPGDSVDDGLTRARELMSQGNAEEALELLDDLYRRHPEDDALRRLTAEAEAEFVERTYRYVVPAGKIPMLTRPVETLSSESLSPQEFFLLSRVDGTWDVKSIIQVSPLREVDALRTLKRMREMGMIELIDPQGG